MVSIESDQLIMEQVLATVKTQRKLGPLRVETQSRISYKQKNITNCIRPATPAKSALKVICKKEYYAKSTNFALTVPL